MVYSAITEFRTCDHRIPIFQRRLNVLYLKIAWACNSENRAIISHSFHDIFHLFVAFDWSYAFLPYSTFFFIIFTSLS